MREFVDDGAVDYVENVCISGAKSKNEFRNGRRKHLWHTAENNENLVSCWCRTSNNWPIKKNFALYRKSPSED